MISALGRIICAPTISFRFIAHYDIVFNMKDSIHELKPEQISSEVFVIAPTQVEYIATLMGNGVADSMNMRAFAPKIRKIAEQSLRAALASAKKQGA